MKQTTNPAFWTELLNHYVQALNDFTTMCERSITKEDIKEFLFKTGTAYGVCYTAMFRFDTNIYRDEHLQQFSDTCKDSFWNDNLIQLLTTSKVEERVANISSALSYRVVALRIRLASAIG